MNGWGGYRPPTWQRPVGWNTLHETPPVITTPVVRERPSDFLFNGILRPAWAYRLELTLIGLLWAVNHWLTGRLGAYDAAQVILALAIVVGLLNWTRDPSPPRCSARTCAAAGRWPAATPTWRPATTGYLGSPASS